MNNFKNSMKRRSIMAAVLMIVTGIILILAQGRTLNFLVQIIGIMVLIGGVTGIVSGVMIAFAPEIIGGIAAACVGFFFYRFPYILVSFIPIIIGLLMVINGCINFANAFKGRMAAGYNPARDMVLSVLAIVLGVLVVIHPFGTANIFVVLMGISLIFNGIVSLVTPNPEK